MPILTKEEIRVIYLENKLEETISAVSMELTFEEYFDGLLFLYQSCNRCICGFDVQGDIRYIRYYSFDDMKEDVSVILPDRPLTPQEEKYIYENYTDYQIHDYYNGDREVVVYSLFYDADEYSVIPRLLPVYKRIVDRVGPIHKEGLDTEEALDIDENFWADKWEK